MQSAIKLLESIPKNVPNKFYNFIILTHRASRPAVSTGGGAHLRQFCNWYFLRHFPVCCVSSWVYIASGERSETLTCTECTHKGTWRVSQNKFILILFVRNSVT
jgi:hypothetical protein